MFPPVYFILLLIIIKCHSYQNSWSSDQTQYKIPRDVMVDVVNNLALKLLAIHNEGNDNNIAISPYGALSVLVALVEGVQGTAADEIRQSVNIPTDLSVIRIGLRDIHRHLKSYFIPEEGFLSGLTLSHDNVTLHREYEDILRFYGFDIDAFNNPLYPDMTTTEKTTVTTDMTSSLTETTTTEIPSPANTEYNGKEMSTESTMVPSTPEAKMTEIPESTTTTYIGENETKTMTTSIIGKTTEMTTTETKTTEMTTTEAKTTEMTTAEAKATEMTTTTEAKAIEMTTTTEATTASVTAEASSPTTISTTTTTPVHFSSESTTTPSGTSTVDLTTEAKTPSIKEETSLPTTLSTTVQTTTTTKSEETTSTDALTTESTTYKEETPTISVTTTEERISTINTEPSSTTSDNTETSTITETSTSTEASTFSTMDVETSTIQIPEVEKREASNIGLNRTIRSVVDYVIARYYDDRVVTQRPPPYISENDLYFLVNDKYKETNINYMTYDTVLPFHYISHLNSLALRFPLDSAKYYLLLLLPEDHHHLNKLICELRINNSLKYIIDNLRYTHVKAIIPSFMLKGYVILTSTFQKMGIKRVFEPRQADFSPMTSDKGIYVTNIEQAITVNIRNYVDPNTMNNNKYLHRTNPILFKADHPFLYFVIDSEIDVTLMAGKIVNPLNSRIR